MQRLPALLPLFATLSLGLSGPLQSQVPELIIGETHVGPGISIIFEGAIKDDVTPRDEHLGEADTDVHLEARVTWSLDTSVAIPKGAVRGGFVPYLSVFAEVENQMTGAKTVVTLVPHLNLADNFHYARNIRLPGSADDSYAVRFTVAPPAESAVALHVDWRGHHGEMLFEEQVVEYRDVAFGYIVRSSRRASLASPDRTN